MASASLRISTLNRGLVTWGFRWAFIATAIFAASRAHVATAAEEIAPTAEIEAKAYDIRTIRPSRSGRVYLFEMGEEGLPVDGKIFLLREGDQPVMALRVLKTYPANLRIAAKKLRTYPGFDTLTRNSRYRAFEKIGDVVAPVPASPEDLQDLQDLESSSIEELPPEAPPEELEETQKALEDPTGEERLPDELPPDAPPAEELPSEDLSGETPPAEESPAEELPVEEPAPPAEEPATEDSASEEEEEEDLEYKSAHSDDDEEHGNYFPNQFTMAVGVLPTPSGRPPGPSLKFGGGLQYARNLSPGIALEGAFFYYKSAGEDSATGNTVTTTMIPIVGTVRIQRHFGELWTGYLYGGLVYPWVSSSIGASARLLQQIQILRPAIGVGTFLQTGPNWYLRMNLGYDAISLGVSLRY